MANKWISVKDRLSEEGKNVIVYIPFKDVYLNYVSYVEDGKWFSPTMFGRTCLAGVTHWQPLPEPPESEE